MKKITGILPAVLLALFMTACGGETSGAQEQGAVEESTAWNQAESETEEASRMEREAESEETEAQESTEENGEEGTEGAGSEDAAASGSLVVYFSYAENAELPDGVDASATASIQPWGNMLTGNTGVVASMIAEATGTDLFSIQTVEKYPDTYDATIDVGQEERNANARPELTSHLENPQDYEVIFLGYPNWWGDMPMAVYSFLEETDLSGKTIVSFVTSGGSGFSNTISAIESLEPDAEVREGLSISGSSATEAQETVEEWLAGLGYMITSRNLDE